MKLEPNHLAPYLSYALQIKVENGIDNGIFELQPVMLTIQDHEGVNKFDKWFVQYESKPLLRPLSDLTKEIEHNGEKFKPINRIPLPKSRPTYLQDLLRLGEGEKDFRTFEYQTIELLFEWHFDVFGLIPKGLAIKKD